VTITGPDRPAGEFELGPGYREIRIAKSLMHLRKEADLNRAAEASVGDVGMLTHIGETPGYVDRLRSVLMNTDIVCLSHPYVFPTIAKIWRGPLWYDAQEVEWDTKRHKLPDSPLKDTLTKAVEHAERACLTASGLMLCRSMKARSRFSELYNIPSDRMRVVPDGYASGSVPYASVKDRKAQREGEQRPPIALFVSEQGLSDRPAIEHLITCARELPEVQFVIAGLVDEAFPAEKRPKNISCPGVLGEEDRKRLLRTAAVAINPTETESDSHLQVIECLAAGIPVISTRLGIRGLGAAEHKYFRICEVHEFPAAIRRIVSGLDEESIDTMVREAHAFVQERHEWKNIGRSLLKEAILSLHSDTETKKEAAVQSSTGSSQAVPVVRRRRDGGLGVNVIGHVTGNLGLGVTARNIVRVLMDRGCKVSIWDMDPGLGRGGQDHTYRDHIVASWDRMPHDINLFVLPPSTIAMLYESSRHMFAGGCFNAAFSMWELPVPSMRHRAALESLDFIIAESEYIRHAFQFHLSGVHATYAPHPLYMPEQLAADQDRFGLPRDSVVFVTGYEPMSDVERKNTRGVIDAFRRSMGNDRNAYLLIKVNNAQYEGRMHKSVAPLQAYAQGHDRIRFITEPMTYEEVLRLYATADVYVSLHRAEGLGLGMMEAMALGKPVIATGWSGNLSFMDHRCACLVRYRLIPANGTLNTYRQDNLGSGAVWADPDISDAAVWMRRLADDASLRSAIGEEARTHMAAFQTVAKQGRFVDEMEMLWRHRQGSSGEPKEERRGHGGLGAPMSTPSILKHDEEKRSNEGGPVGPRSLRILFQNRPTAKSHPGGDTVVMNLLRRELERLGHRVDVALGPQDLSGYDLVQAFNFATPDVTEDYARRAVASNVPLIVAAIYEDWPLFLKKSLAVTEVLRGYLQQGRNEAAFREDMRRVAYVSPAKRANNEFAARNAACLLAWSESEQSRLLRDYPGCRVEVVRLGADHLQVKDVEPGLFEKTYGVKDFVLCVGRLETRKNQLMLLKALEHDPMPVVFLTGGFSYQPEYVKLCQTFGRQAKTLFLDRLPEEMLASAYRAARVLCMPSWYELPGLVALEALHLGCPVVASRWGTLPDYIPQGVEYCDPDNPDSIRAAILKSYKERNSVALHELVRDFQWQKTAAQLVSNYEAVLHQHRSKDRSIRRSGNDSPGRKSLAVQPVSEDAVPGLACSIVMPVHNNLDMTKQCLTALSEMTQGVEYEVILVDNGSSNETREFLGSLRGDVQVIRNEEHVGFVKACNQGARVARGRYVVFLHSDSIPQPGWLSAMVAEVETHPEVGVVGGKLLDKDGTVQHAGVVFDRSQGVPYHIYRGVPGDALSVNQRREYQAVTGGCLLVRRSIVMEIGGFDEQFNDGLEDVDLCLKAKDRGYHVVYQPRSVIYRPERQSPGRDMRDASASAYFLQRWGERWWLSDEDFHYHADGCKLHNGRLGGNAMTCMEELTDVRDRAAWAHVAAAQAAALKNDWTGLRRELSLGQDWPKDPSLLFWAAQVCEKLGETALQQSFLGRFLELKESPGVRLSLVRALLTQKNLVAAEQHLNALLSASPGDGEGQLLRGVLCMQREQYREAEDAFSIALQHGADRKKCLMGLGMASLGRAYAQGAWERFLQVLTEHPDDAEAIHWLLRAGTAQNRWEDLSEHLRAYLSRNPGDLAVRLALAGVLVRADRIEEARKEHDTLRMLDPTYDGLAELGEAIAREEAVLAMEAAEG
jgi:glycosyltransferase involved in cell wall biosynthesis/GT2 family glycosyltransferase/tetratricopeptide (TPR) repeat protein